MRLQAQVVDAAGVERLSSLSPRAGIAALSKRVKDVSDKMPGSEVFRSKASEEPGELQRNHSPSHMEVDAKGFSDNWFQREPAESEGLAAGQDRSRVDERTVLKSKLRDQRNNEHEGKAYSARRMALGSEITVSKKLAFWRQKSQDAFAKILPVRQPSLSDADISKFEASLRPESVPAPPENALTRRGRELIETLVAPEFDNTSKILKVAGQSQSTLVRLCVPLKKFAGLGSRQLVVARSDGLFLFEDPMYVKLENRTTKSRRRGTSASSLNSQGSGNRKKSADLEPYIHVGSAFFWEDVHLELATENHNEIVLRGNARTLWWDHENAKLSCDRLPVVVRESFSPAMGSSKFLELFDEIHSEQVARGYRTGRSSLRLNYLYDEDDEDDEFGSEVSLSYSPVSSSGSSGSCAGIASSKSGEAGHVFITRAGRSMAVAIVIQSNTTWYQFCEAVNEALNIDDAEDRIMYVRVDSFLERCYGMSTLQNRIGHVVVVS
mmetsp:Transcript_21067/g.37315  ORF Transcript_21067/g.37315 Transcript_21067/m.37315 type:complete len:494 (-) Transcript_21067:62-1543(-)